MRLAWSYACPAIHTCTRMACHVHVHVMELDRDVYIHRRPDATAVAPITLPLMLGTHTHTHTPGAARRLLPCPVLSLELSSPLSHRESVPSVITRRIEDVYV